MKIEFNSMEETCVKNFRGGEKETTTKMFSDEHNRIMLGRLVPGASIGMHTHDTDCEIVYILGGKGKALYGNGQETLAAGDCHYCPRGHAHSLINDGNEDLVFFAVIPQQQ